MNAALANLLPEAVLAVGVLAVLVADMLLPTARKSGAGFIGVAVCIGALLAAAAGGRGPVDAMLSIDGLAALARPGVLIATLLVLMAGRCEQQRDDGLPAWTALVLSLALGAMLTAAASNLVSLFLGLELMSLAGYALAGWKAGSRQSAEAGMKYVLFGGAATGVMLFGMSHLYGLTGHLDFHGIGQALGQGMPLAVVAALLLAGVGIAYKLAVVPFHFYAPDVYQGAPAIAVAALGTVPKIAAAAVLVRGILAILPQMPSVTLASFGWTLSLIAVASLLLSAFAAVVARDAKRIVAFSAIGHAGAIILAIATLPGGGAIAAAAFYLAAYAVANIGALVCLAVLERERGSAGLDALAGAMRQRPWLTAALCLFLFSLAGVPPLAGFLAKWGVLREALHAGLEPGRSHLAWASLALLASTAISAWAYLLIVRAAVLQPAPEQQPASRLAPGTAAVLALCALATIALGLWLDGFSAIAAALGRG
jgi:NADH-quinone oxidoreductase subunit N